MYDVSHNTLQIRGDKELVEQCLKKIGLAKSEGVSRDAFTFMKIMPPPPAYKEGKLTEEELRAKYGSETAEGWCSENWEMCSDAEYTCYDEKNDAYHFRTHGEDGYLVIEELSKQFPSLEFIFGSQSFPFPSALFSFDAVVCKLVNGSRFPVKFDELIRGRNR